MIEACGVKEASKATCITAGNRLTGFMKDLVRGGHEHDCKPEGHPALPASWQDMNAGTLPEL